MPDLLTDITEKYPSLTKVERHIASFVLENSTAVTRMSIFELAKACGIGSTSIFRFCQDLGIEGYADFKIRLSQALAARGGVQNPDDSADRLPDTTLLQRHVSEITALARNIVLETGRQLDCSALKTAAEIITRARRVCFVGFGESLLPALDAKLRFMKLVDSTEFSMDEHMQLMSIALMSDRDAVVLFSMAEDEKEAISVANLAKQNQVRVIAITQYHSAALQRLCDVFLPTIHHNQEKAELLVARYSQTLLLDLLVGQCNDIWSSGAAGRCVDKETVEPAGVR